MIDAVTVCVDYSDYLEHVIENNRKCFDRWLIVTAPHDTATICLCKTNNVECIVSDRVMDGGFCKGRAINDGLVYLNARDWIVQLDADTLLNPQDFKKSLCSRLDKNKFYGLIGRYQVNSIAELRQFCDQPLVFQDQLEHVGLMVGYFQMWHSTMRQLYPEESLTAGLDDILMRDSYHTDKWAVLGTYAVHLGPMWVNHGGRKSERFK